MRSRLYQTSRISCGLLLSLALVACPDPPAKLTVAEYIGGGQTDVGDAGVPTDVGDAGEVDEPEDVVTPDVEDGVMPDLGPPPDMGPPDMGPPDAGCVPQTEDTDPCDGIDNDCDGETDEDGGPPELAQPITMASAVGWRRTSAKGTIAHAGAPAAFAGYLDNNTVVWTRMQPWSGDIELDVQLVLSQVAPTGEFFIGAWAGEVVAGPELRTGVVITRASDSDVLVTGVVAGQAVGEVQVAVGSFHGVYFRLQTQPRELLVRLQTPNGTKVDDFEASIPEGLIPSYAGLAFASTGGPILGSVGRIDIGPGIDCKPAPAPTCTECAAPGTCEVSICNPLLGCEIQPLSCALEGPCTKASTCDEETGECTAIETKSDGAECDDGDGCTEGESCQAGTCEGGSPVVCPAPNQCQEAGTCNAFFAECVYPEKGEGMPCDDESQCTSGETCQSGECTPAQVVTCDESGPCETKSVCDEGTGECSAIEPLEDGSECDDGDLCTSGDTCLEGSCTGELLVCDDDNLCTSDACVDGECVFTASDECELWKVALGGPITGPPALGPDGQLYAVSSGLHAVDTDGQVLWQSSGIVSVTTATPAVSSDGMTIYLSDTGAGGPRIVAVKATDGSILWSWKVEGTCNTGEADPCRTYATPTVAGNGTVLVATQGAGVVAVAPDLENPGSGKLLWSATYEGGRSSVVLSKAGTLFVGQGGTTPGVRSLGADGSERWLFATDDPVNATPIVVGSTIYYVAGTKIGQLTDGASEATSDWTRDLGAPVGDRQPVLASGGLLIVTSQDTLWAFDPAACAADQEGCQVWTSASPAAGNINKALSATSNGMVIFGSPNALQFVVAADGSPSIAIPQSALGPTAPVLLPDGKLVVGGTDGAIRALGYEVGVTPADTAWPVFNRRQSRNALE